MQKTLTAIACKQDQYDEPWTACCQSVHAGTLLDLLADAASQLLVIMQELHESYTSQGID